MTKKGAVKILCFLLLASSFVMGGLDFSTQKFDTQKAKAYGFDPGYVIDDNKFVDKDSMSVNDIQYFLNDKNSVLKDYSENSRSAAQIIYDAAHGYGEASGPPPNGCHNGICINNDTGSVSSKTLLVTLQKEQSLISGHSFPLGQQHAIDCAMGYGALEGGGCRWMFENRPQYKGFTNQVEWAAWQLRYNYERSAGHGFSDYQVGQTMPFDNQQVRIDNRATASLYRYTPHIQYRFSDLYRDYFGSPVGGTDDYYAEVNSKSDNPTLNRNGSATLEVKFLNTGWETWYKDGDNPMRLGLDKYWAKNGKTAWQGSGWINENRMSEMQEDSVEPGHTGTFRFEIHCPDDMPPGSHRFKARLVSEHLTWFDNPRENGYVYWDININGPQAQWVEQSNNQIIAWPGETHNLSVTFKNTGQNSWISPVRLATDRFKDEDFLKRFKNDNWINDYRISESNSAEPNQETKFDFSITIPDDIGSGKYRFDTRLVSEGYSWFEDGGAWWEITIPRPQAEWVEQSEYPTLYRGDSTTLWVKFRNTTGKTWPSSGNHPVRLGLDKHWKSSTAMQGLGWHNENRMGTAMEGDIAPDNIGTYRYNIYIPPDTEPGKSRFYVRLVSEHYSWFDNPDLNGGAWWEITVK